MGFPGAEAAAEGEGSGDGTAGHRRKLAASGYTGGVFGNTGKENGKYYIHAYM